METTRSRGGDAHLIVFPVVAGKMNSDRTYEITEIYGTAFYIKNKFFITCAHTIKSAFEVGHAALLVRKGLTEITAIPINEVYDLFESNDSCIFKCQVDEAYAYAWDLTELKPLQDVLSVGYPYGLVRHDKRIQTRYFKGYVSSPAPNCELAPSSIYELSYQVPRGLSGAPLLHTNSQKQDFCICGMTIGNEQTDMTINLLKETDVDNNQTTVYERVEAFTRGIAVQVDSFLNLESRLLKGPLGDYLVANDLVCKI